MKVNVSKHGNTEIVF